MLYLSLYFKTYRKAYYNHLQLIRETGNWEKWLIFFLKGVIDTANQATNTAKKILDLFEQDYKKISTIGKASAATLKVMHHYLQRKPITDTSMASKKCDLTLPTILRAFKILEQLGIVKEISGKERKRIYVYKSYLNLLNE